MIKWLMMMLAMMLMMAQNVMAAATDFATSIPASLLPDGFWTLVALVFGVVVTIGGIVIGIKLVKRARG